MGIIRLPIDCIVSFGGMRVTDHKRSPLSMSTSKIENKKRMADGTLRRFVVAEKRKFRLSWEDLPNEDSKTVDGFAGVISIYEFYKDNQGSFTMTITYGDKSTENVLVMFEDFNYKLKKRGSYTDLYDLDISLDEV